MIGFAAIVEPMLAGRGINRHSADGIAHLRVADGVVVMMTVVGVIVTSAAPRLRGRFGLAAAFDLLLLRYACGSAANLVRQPAEQK